MQTCQTEKGPPPSCKYIISMYVFPCARMRVCFNESSPTNRISGSPKWEHAVYCKRQLHTSRGDTYPPCVCVCVCVCASVLSCIWKCQEMPRRWICWTCEWWETNVSFKTALYFVRDWVRPVSEMTEHWFFPPRQRKSWLLILRFASDKLFTWRTRHRFTDLIAKLFPALRVSSTRLQLQREREREGQKY